VVTDTFVRQLAAPCSDRIHRIEERGGYAKGKRACGAERGEKGEEKMLRVLR
jgi:hypothetical protein